LGQSRAAAGVVAAKPSNTAKTSPCRMIHRTDFIAKPPLSNRFDE
jgi:hypothetical protein